MFTLAQPAYYSSYNPYEELLLQQELQRIRQVEAYLRRQREAEELEYRRQFEYAIRQAEVERRRQAEYERRRAEVEQQQRRDAQRGRRSMFDAGVQDLFDMIYGGDSRLRSRSMSPRASPAREQPEGSQQNADSNDEKPVPAETPSSPIHPSSPAPELSPSVAAADEEPEDETPQIDTAPSLAAVQSVLASFATLQSEFTFPAELDFLPSSPTSSPKLAYTSNNAPIHRYEHALTGLLTQLDAVESFGDDEVRRTRKETVKAIEKELEDLDARKAKAWRNQSEPEVSATQESVEAEPVATVDPLAVPLPDDSDVENQDEEMGEAVPEALPGSEHSDAAASTVPTESPLAAPETLSAPTQSLIVEGLPPVPDSPMTIASPITPELPGLTPLAIPSDTSTEPQSQSLGSPSSEASDTESDMELEDYVDVDHVLASKDEMEQEDAELEEVEKDGDLELIRDWDLAF